MFNKYKITKSLLFLFLSISKYICDYTEKNEKQLKYDACYKLIQIKGSIERAQFKELSTELSQEEINNVLQYTFYECYQNINYYDAEEIDSKDFKDINVYQENYASLLNFGKWIDLLRSKDENSIQLALFDLQQAYRDIQSGDIKINRYQKKPQNPRQKREESEKNFPNDDQEEFNVPRDVGGDFELFGVDFSKMSPLLKNIIGLSLIVFIFLCVIGGLTWIKKIRGENKNKKKKNKKEKKK